jgi:ferredoxin
MELDPRSPERGQYGFVQSLIREVAYGTLSKRDRRSRHLAAARYFEALGDDELAGALATHYLAAHEASADGAERDTIAIQARRALRAAGARAADLGGHEQAVTFYREALRVTTQPLDRAALIVMLPTSALPSGQEALAESSTREAIEIYESDGDWPHALAAAALLGRVLIDNGRLHDVVPELESILARRKMPVGGQTAWVDPDKCISCMTCVHVCPYMAPQVNEFNKAEVQGPVCMGCGSCTAECPAKAITLRHFMDSQILAAVNGLLGADADRPAFAPELPEQVGVAQPRWRKS